MIRILVLFALVLFSSPAAAWAQDGSSGSTAAPGPVLRPGDRVGIQVWRSGELSGTFTVAEDGTLLHPLYGAVSVAGIPIPEARQRVRRFLEGFEADPKFTLVPEYRVYVGGSVRDPNQHHLPEMSVGQAITRAGGSIAPNRTHRVRLIRADEHTVANLNSPRINELLQEPIRSGDQVIVEERPTFNRTYVGPALQILQTVGSLLGTYFIITQVFGSDDSGGE